MFFSLFSLSLEFWNEPHMSIVRIAEKSIPEKHSQWLNILFNTWPSENSSMITASTWQDDINDDVARLMMHWHFTSIPIVADGFNFTNFAPTYNVSSVLKDTLDGLFDPTTTNLWAIHFLFRNLEHFLGDAHTPVHTAAYYSEQFSKGDRGGNKVRLVPDSCPYGDPCKNLHKLWDSGVLNYQYRYLDNKTVLQEFEYNISHVMSMHDESSFEEVDNLDPDVWVSESHKIAVEYAYGKLVDMPDKKAKLKKLSPDYIEEGQQQVELIVAKAGYRLARIIEKFFELHNLDDPRKVQVEKMPAREIILWIIDAVLIVVVIVYAILILLDNNIGCFKQKYSEYVDI